MRTHFFDTQDRSSIGTQQPSTWRRRLITGAGIVFAALALFAAPAAAMHNTGKFQLDGNTGGTKSGLPDDWDNVYRSVTGKSQAHTSSALVQFFTADGNEPDYSVFGTGHKDTQRVSQWTCGTDKNPYGTTNVLSAFGAAYSTGGRLHFFFGADRESSSGNPDFGFWLFQTPVSCVSKDKGGSGRFTGHKTHGDVFVTSEFNSSNRLQKVKVYKWTDPDRIPENGDECLGDGVDCTAAHAGADHPAVTGIDCQSSDPHAGSPIVCATVNSSGYTSTWRTCTGERELWEGGLDLTALLNGEAGCFATFMAETRSSQKFDADLKDFVLAELGTCGEITIKKKAIGGDDHFDFDVMAGTLTPSPFTLQNGGTQTFTGVKPGAYAIKELAAPAGWQLTDLSCAASGGDTTASTSVPNATATITMGLAGTVECTFTNTKQPRLTVVKKVQNDNGGALTTGDFTLKIDGSTVTSGVPVAVSAGSHVVAEGAVPAGYVQVGITGDCDATGKITLALGDSKTCVITNRDLAPKLTVIKKVVNGSGGTKTAADFTMQVTGTGVSLPSFPGSETGTTVTLKAGAFSVDEAAAAGYAKSFAGDCSGTIAVGEAKTCTITNTQTLAKLIVIKKVVNARGGTKVPGDFTMTVAGKAASLTSFPGSDAPGTTVTLKAGAYSVDEIPVAGYAKSLSADCAGTIAAGETRTCTVTNTAIAPQITVIKHVINDNGGVRIAADFSMRVTGGNVSTPAFAGSEAGVTVTLDAGAYAVDEADPLGYKKTIGAGCSGTIALGDKKTCIVTNDDPVPAPFSSSFCDRPSTLALMDASSGRFVGNRGPDVVVDTRRGSIQGAIDNVTDVNEDGFLIIGVVAKDDGQPGGLAREYVEIKKVYDKPFALVACGVLIQDPMQCDGVASVRIRPTASSPAYPAGTGAQIFLHGLGSQNSLSSAGYLVEGDGRVVDGAAVGFSLIGIKVVGNGNAVQNGTVHDNITDGLVIEGHGNTVDGITALNNSTGDGIRVTGNDNTIANSNGGGVGQGNGGHGIEVNGTGNLLKKNTAFANQGNGITVNGGTAARPNVVKQNTGGAFGAGNIGSGIAITGAGNGGASPIEVASNIAQGNFEHGIKVSGGGHQLKGNASSGNVLCEFKVGLENLNGTGNTIGAVATPIAGADGSPFPNGCR